ncbi:glycine zipper family protein [Collimonas sp.]|uniref:glycine zipper family protein n=1 Tax=Collimonas sp. TaxID=1963772 RepID=UPI002C20D7CE|nr:glycine zipper family protein [Collimonas sp.]HWW07356.1 glycine zipper family protein [Collimonas sp.]
MNGIKGTTKVIAASMAVLLSGCVTAPAGPNVMALPGAGKSYEQFRNDEAVCQRAAQERVGPYAPQAAADNAAGTAVAGTLIGATAGALIGAATGRAGAGAAIGGGVGLLAGSSVAGDSAARSSYGMQRQYNNVYTQCMYAKGNQVPVAGGYANNRRQYAPPPQYSVPPDYYPPQRGNYGPPPDYAPY